MLRRLPYLNGLAILAVIINHAAHQGFTALFWWTDRYVPGAIVPDFTQIGSIQYYVLIAMVTLTHYCVPTFLFTTGFFAAYSSLSNRSGSMGKIIGPRLKNIIIPYLIWSLVFLLAEVFESCLHGKCEFLVKDSAFRLATATINPSLWYIPLLIQLYLLLPFLVKNTQKNWKLTLGVSFAIQMAAQIGAFVAARFIPAPTAGIIGDVSNRLFPSSIFYFVLGMVIVQNLAAFKALFHPHRKWLLILSVLFALISLYTTDANFRAVQQPICNPLFLDGFILTFILYFLSSDDLSLPLRRQIQYIAPQTFGIYLLHYSILIYTARAMYHLAPALLPYQIIFQPLLILVGLAIPLVVMYLVKKIGNRVIFETLFG